MNAGHVNDTLRLRTQILLISSILTGLIRPTDLSYQKGSVR